MNEVATKKDNPMDHFLGKVRDKIRDDIASMIPDEAINKLIEEVVREEFFTKKKIVSGDRWNEKITYDHTEFQKLVLENITPHIKERADKFFVDNQEEITKLIDQILQQGFMNLFENFLKMKFTEHMQANSHIIQNMMQSQNQRGY